MSADAIFAVAVDGRGADDAGMTLWEFADLPVDLDLDGGAASVLISSGQRINVPRDDDGQAMDMSSPAVTAIVFLSR